MAKVKIYEVLPGASVLTGGTVVVEATLPGGKKKLIDVDAPPSFVFTGIDNDPFFVLPDPDGAYRIIAAPKHLDTSDDAPDIADLTERLEGAEVSKRAPK